MESIPEFPDRGFHSSGILSEGDKRDINGTRYLEIFSTLCRNTLVGAIWLRSQHLGLGLGESGLPSPQHFHPEHFRSECQGRPNALI